MAVRWQWLEVPIHLLSDRAVELPVGCDWTGFDCLQLQSASCTSGVHVSTHRIEAWICKGPIHDARTRVTVDLGHEIKERRSGLIVSPDAYLEVRRRRRRSRGRTGGDEEGGGKEEYQEGTGWVEHVDS